jgi:hypothetical protein
MNNGVSDETKIKILDSLSENPVLCRNLFRNRESFEGFFNIPWPEASAESIVESMRQLVVDGLVETDGFVKYWNPESIYGTKASLTKSGGRLWEKLFNVDYNKFYWYSFELVENDGRVGISLYSLIVRSISKDFSKNIIGMISESVFGGNIVYLRSVRKVGWREFYWRRFRIYYESKCVFSSKSPALYPDISHTSFRKAESLRYAWRVHNVNLDTQDSPNS